MEHIAYCDAKAWELVNLLAGTKTMLIRGAAGRKLPYGRVFEGEPVYFIENDGSGQIKARGVVSRVHNSEKMTEEQSRQLITDNMDKLKLTDAQVKRWAGKRYLCLVEVQNVQSITPFSYSRAKNMDDWIIVEDIDILKK